MIKKVYTVVEIIKIFILSWFVGLVHHVAISNDYTSPELVVIGYTFLIMLVTVIISSIVLDILLSFFTTKEKKVFGEWEKFVQKNILRNFAYMLSLFYVAVMISFALAFSFDKIMWVFRIGFFLLIATIHITRIYYYEG